TDRTVQTIHHQDPFLPFPVRLHLGPPRMPIGAARNLGVKLARAPLVAFVSADAEIEPDWVAHAMASLETTDMAFGPQVHAPQQWSVAAAVRGLRYQFPRGPTATPLRFASNVAAAYRKPVLLRFPFEPGANAAEDLLLAIRAKATGHAVTYAPGMVVRHRDVGSLRQELRKNLREGAGCGRYAAELGVQWPVLAWGALLAAAATLPFFNLAWGLAALAGVLWLPALRRGLRHRKDMPARHLMAGVAASPPFDLAFLVQYLRGLLGARRHARQRSKEIPA
ncbi:MAG: glycosyltransferase, partial [Candidatus Thermoplasmatota archaeon]